MTKQTATRESVREYLLKESGVRADRVDALLDKGQEFIDRGRTMGSYPYFVGNAIMRLHGVDEDLDPDFVPPDDEYEEDE